VIARVAAGFAVALALGAGCRGDDAARTAPGANPGAAAAVRLRARPAEVVQVTLKALGVT